MDDFDRKWKLIQDQLGAQIRGDEPARFSSGRTLFGIQSGVEAKMDEIAKEMEAEAAERRKRQREREARNLTAAHAKKRGNSAGREPDGCHDGQSESRS